jgi:hypothetical protein
MMGAAVLLMYWRFLDVPAEIVFKDLIKAGVQVLVAKPNVARSGKTGRRRVIHSAAYCVSAALPSKRGERRCPAASFHPDLASMS